MSEKDCMANAAYDGEKIIFVPAQQSGMQSIRIADGVRCIDAQDMKDCLGCTEIILCQTLETIENGALRCCQTEKIHIPANVSYIGRQAFCVGCRLTVDEGNEKYYTDGHALLRRENDGVALQLLFDDEMEAYTIPGEVTSIDEDAFDDCYALSALTLPQGMQAFSAAALGHCRVGQVSIPASVSKVDGWHRFHAVIDAENPYFQQTEQMIFRLLEHGKKELVRFTGDEECVEVPDCVIGIGDYAFAYSDINMAVLPESVEEIGAYAFFASSLRLLDLPAEGVRQIGDYAFAQTQLESVLVPATLARIPQNCFAHSCLNHVSIPFSIAEIGAYAFEGTKLETVYLPATVRVLADTAFCGCESLTEISVESSDAGFRNIEGLILNEEQTRALAWPAARVCEELVLPPSVTEIGMAFSGSKGIETLRIQGALSGLQKDALHAQIGTVIFEREPESVHKEAIRPLYAGSMELHVSMNSCLPVLLEAKNIIYVFSDADEAFQAAQERFCFGYEEGGYTILSCMDWQERIEIPERIGDTPVLRIGSYAFSEKLHGIYPVEIVIPEGIVELKRAALFWMANTVRQIEMPASVQVISDDVFADENGQYRDMFLHQDLVFYTIAGSPADVFLRAYRRKPGDPRGEELIVISREAIIEEPEVIEEEPEVIEEEPEVIEEEPEVIEEEPEVIEEEPEVIEEEPEVIEEGSEVVEEEPEVIEEEPEVVEEEPEVVEEETEVIEEETEVVEEPEVIEEEPEVIEEEPEVIEEAPIIIEEKPEVVEEEPKIIVEEPESIEEAPEIIEEVPMIIVEEPEIIEAVPAAAEEEPEAIEPEPVLVAAAPVAEDGAERIWKISRKKGRVTRYLGGDTKLTYPSEVDGVKITGIADAKGKQAKAFRRITSVVIPHGYTQIGAGAFADCKHLETVVLPDTITEIGKYAFEGCRSLKTLDLPKSVKRVGKGAFKDSGMKQVIVRSKKLSMKKNVLSGCKKARVYAPFDAKVQKVFGSKARSIWEIEQ